MIRMVEIRLSSVLNGDRLTALKIANNPTFFVIFQHALRNAIGAAYLESQKFVSLFS